MNRFFWLASFLFFQVAAIALSQDSANDVYNRISAGAARGRPGTEPSVTSVESLIKLRPPRTKTDLEKSKIILADKYDMSPGDNLPCFGNLRIGTVGIPNNLEMTVERIVDDENMLVQIWWGDPQYCWVKGLSTKGLIDGNNISLYIRALMEITGTKRVPTPEGTKTVLLMEPYPINVFASLVQENSPQESQVETHIPAPVSKLDASSKVGNDSSSSTKSLAANTSTTKRSSGQGDILPWLGIIGLAATVAAYFYFSGQKTRRTRSRP